MVPSSCAAQMNRPVTPAAWADAGAAELLGANWAMTSAENPATTSAEMLISRISREPRRPRNTMGTPWLSREASVREADFGEQRRLVVQSVSASSADRLSCNQRRLQCRRRRSLMPAAASVLRGPRWSPILERLASDPPRGKSPYFSGQGGSGLCGVSL